MQDNIPGVDNIRLEVAFAVVGAALLAALICILTMAYYGAERNPPVILVVLLQLPFTLCMMMMSLHAFVDIKPPMRVKGLLWAFTAALSLAVLALSFMGDVPFELTAELVVVELFLFFGGHVV